MKYHKEKMHEGMIYQCDQCDFIAGFSEALKRHKENKHVNTSDTNYLDEFEMKTEIKQEDPLKLANVSLIEIHSTPFIQIHSSGDIQ